MAVIKKQTINFGKDAKKEKPCTLLVQGENIKF
jgi:hypothetical protein